MRAGAASSTWRSARRLEVPGFDCDTLVEANGERPLGEALWALANETGPATSSRPASMEWIFMVISLGSMLKGVAMDAEV